MDIKLNVDQVKDIVSEAVLRSLDQDTRNTLIQGAIKSLLEPVGKDTMYSKAKSPLQQAFEQAVYSVAISIARETMEKDTIVQQQIKVLLTEAMEKVMIQNREKTVDLIANAITTGMGGGR